MAGHVQHAPSHAQPREIVRPESALHLLHPEVHPVTSAAMIARLVVADFSPVAGTSATAATAHTIGFGDIWLTAVSGARTSAPGKATPIGNARDGMRPLTPAELREPWAKALGKVDYVTRVMRAKPDGIALVTTARGPNDVIDLWWCRGSEAQLVRKSLGRDVSVELLADGVGVLLDRKHRRLERVQAGARESVAIALPAIVEPAEQRGDSRPFAALRETDVLVIAGAKRCYWTRIGDLLSPDLGRSCTWKITWAFPDADPDARRTGTVTMCKYGVTNIEFPDGKKQFSGDFRVAPGETISLVGKLWEQLGSVQYREIERADGTRMPMPGAPHMVAEQTTEVVKLGHDAAAAAPVVVPPALRAQIDAMRACKLFGELTEAVLAEHLEGRPELDIVALALAYYEQSDERARRDRFLVHDWRFGQETSDVIAELCALIGDPPLFVQLAVEDDGIAVRGPSGEDFIAVESLDDVVAHVNAVLDGGTPFGDVRFHALQTGDDRHAYFLLGTLESARLRAAGIPLLAI